MPRDPSLLLIALAAVPIGAGFAALWLRHPVLLASVGALTYAAIRALLNDASLVQLGDIDLNASKLFVGVMSALLLARVALGWLATSSPVGLPRTRTSMNTANGLRVCVAVLLALVVLSAVASRWSPYPGEGLSAALRLGAGWVALVFAVWAGRRGGGVASFALVAELAAGIAALSALVEFAMPRDALAVLSEYDLDDRAGGSLGTPVLTGIVMTVGVPPLAARLLGRPSPRARAWALGLLALIAAGLIATFTRRAQLCVLLFGLSLVFSLNAGGALEWARRALLAGLAGVALTLGLLIVDPELVAGRLRDLPGLGELEISDPMAGNGRVRIWSAVATEVAEGSPAQWMLGHGTASSFAPVLRSTGSPTNAHSSYLELLHGNGVLGLGLYLAFLVLLVRTLRRTAAAGGPGAIAADCWWRYLVCYALVIDAFGSDVHIVSGRYYVMLAAGALCGAELLRHAATRGAAHYVRSPAPSFAAAAGARAAPRSFS